MTPARLLLLAAGLCALAAAVEGRALKGGRKYEGRVCKWKAELEFDAIRFVDHFDCGMDVVMELNPWLRERGRVRKGDLCDLPCDAEYKPRKDRKRWHHHGDICQFKADRDYTRDEFSAVFGIEFWIIFEINQDWCGGTTEVDITVIKKGEVWDVPCSCKNRERKDWQWRPRTKRSWRGNACKWKADREEHPRRLAKRFNIDWDVCLELNPWFVARKRIGVDEECYMPCDCEHEERGKSWRIEITVYVCEFDRPEPPRPPKCIFCPGDWNWCRKPEWEWFDPRCDPRPDYRHPIVTLPEWICMPKDRPSWYNSDKSYGPPRYGGTWGQQRDSYGYQPDYGYGGQGGGNGYGYGQDVYGQDYPYAYAQGGQGGWPQDGGQGGWDANPQDGAVWGADPTGTDMSGVEAGAVKPPTDCAVPPCTAADAGSTTGSTTDGSSTTGTTDGSSTSTDGSSTTTSPGGTKPEGEASSGDCAVPPCDGGSSSSSGSGSGDASSGVGPSDGASTGPSDPSSTDGGSAGPSDGASTGPSDPSTDGGSAGPSDGASSTDGASSSTDGGSSSIDGSSGPSDPSTSGSSTDTGFFTDGGSGSSGDLPSSQPIDPSLPTAPTDGGASSGPSDLPSGGSLGSGSVAGSDGGSAPINPPVDPAGPSITTTTTPTTTDVAPLALNPTPVATTPVPAECATNPAAPGCPPVVG